MPAPVCAIPLWVTRRGSRKGLGSASRWICVYTLALASFFILVCICSCALWEQNSNFRKRLIKFSVFWNRVTHSYQASCWFVRALCAELSTRLTPAPWLALAVQGPGGLISSQCSSLSPSKNVPLSLLDTNMNVRERAVGGGLCWIIISSQTSRTGLRKQFKAGKP